MRTFTEGRLARGTAYLLSGVFLWSVVFMGVGAVPAAAQIVTKGAATQSVAVVPFQNRTKLHPETLGDEAADAVSVELRDRLLLDVLPKADVSLQMRDLGLVPPLSDVEMVRLATELDIGIVMAGEVRGARIVQTKEGRYAEVVLAVRLFDRVARADVNGAVVAAVSPASEASDEALLGKAMQQAAFAAVQQMKERPTVVAMVLWSRGDTVFLNVGTRGGLRPGMRLVAVRGGERIGLAKVTEADAIGAYATSVEGPPLRTGDSMRAVYDLPAGVKVERVGVAQERRNRFETMAIMAAVFLGLGNYASRARRVDEGNTTAPGFKASNLGNGAQFGLSGWFMSFQFPLRDIQPRPAALLTWEGYQSSEKGRIAAYEIIRGGQIVEVLAGAGVTQVTSVVDTGINAPGLQVVSFTVDEVGGGVIELTSEFTPWEPEFNPDTNAFENPTWAEFVDGISDQVGTFQDGNTLTIGWLPSELPGDDIGGMFPELQYQYAIRPIIATQLRDGTWALDDNTQFTTFRNVVVGVAPAGVFPTHEVFQGLALGVYEVFDTLPNPEGIGNVKTFFFYYPFGATDIIFQITREPNITFTPPGVVTLPIRAAGPDLLPEDRDISFRGQHGFPFDVDLSLVPGSSPLFFWRIGARSLFDTHPARNLDGEEVGYVFSDTGAFDISHGASRAEAMHEERQAMDALRAARARLPRTATGERLHRAE